MTATIADADLLDEFAKILADERMHFEAIKNDMDRALHGFVFDDQVGHKFKTQYEERLALLKTKLFPAMEEYAPHLREEAEFIREWLRGDSNNVNSETFAIAEGTAAVLGGVVTVSAVAAMYEGKNYSSVFKGVDLSSVNWGQKTRKQKIDELQKLENNIAKIQRRKPDKVSAEQYTTWKTWDDYKKGEKITAGIHSGNEIKINKSLLEGDNTYEKLKLSVNTIAHEGQHDNQEEKNLFSNNTGANYIRSEGDNKPVCIIEYNNGQIDRKATVLKFRKAAINNPQAQVHNNWRTSDPNIITNPQNINANYKIVKDTISKSNSPLSADCDWDDYAYGNEKEVDSRKFGSYIEKQFEQKFPEKTTMKNTKQHK